MKARQKNRMSSRTAWTIYLGPVSKENVKNCLGHSSVDTCLCGMGEGMGDSVPSIEKQTNDQIKQKNPLEFE